LSQTWHGVCWMNPPYGREISSWVKKAYESSIYGGTVVVCLLPARTDTAWWHDYVTCNRDIIPGFIRVRLCRGAFDDAVGHEVGLGDDSSYQVARVGFMIRISCREEATNPG
jgi:hypothetical protein